MNLFETYLNLENKLILKSRELASLRRCKKNEAKRKELMNEISELSKELKVLGDKIDTTKELVSLYDEKLKQTEDAHEALTLIYDDKGSENLDILIKELYRVKRL